MMITTHNDLSEEVRSKEVTLLNQRLADAIDITYQAKQAHWNVKGMEFRSLHKLFDEVAEKVDEYVDIFAERLVQLGGVAEGTIQSVQKNTSMPEYPIDVLEGRDHLAKLCAHVSHYARLVREGIDVCSDLGDQATADIFTDAAKDTDELVWMLESHLFDKTKAGARSPRGVAAA